MIIKICVEGGAKKEIISKTAHDRIVSSFSGGFEGEVNFWYKVALKVVKALEAKKTFFTCKAF